MHPTLASPFSILLFTTLTAAQETLGPVLTSSFTWNAQCGATVACGPSAAGFAGTGFAAANNVTYAAGQPIVNGVGKGCGQCWHLMPEQNAYIAPGKSLGTPVVVKINDQCTDPKYCDQYEFGNNSPLNTGYQKQVHFDLCHESGVTSQFFGQVEAGVALGLAQQVSCDNLQNGKFGQKMGKLSLSGGGGGSNSGGLRLTSGVDLNSNKLGGEGGGRDTGSSSSVGAVASVQSSTTPVVAGQPSTTLATVVGAASSGIPPASGAGVGNGGEDEQDECDEL